MNKQCKAAGHQLAQVLAVAAIVALAGCGGGGGGGDSGASVSTGASAGSGSSGGSPSGTGTAGSPGGSGSGSSGSGSSGGTAGGTPGAGAGGDTTPVPAVTTPPSSSYAGTDDNGEMESATFAYLNAVRIGGSAGALQQDLKLDAAARAHSAYTQANPFEYRGNEMAGHAGFTGVTPADRLAAAGYAGTSWGESVANYARLSGADSARCAQVLLNSMYSMASVMGPYRDLGIGYKTDASGAGYCVLDFAYSGGMQYPPAGTVVAYPYPGQTDAAASFSTVGETPAPPAALGSLVGQPIYAGMSSMAVVSGDGSNRGSVEAFALTDAAGNAVPAWLLAPGTTSVAAGIELMSDPATQPKYLPYGVFLVPKSPLVAGATYSVHFAGHYNGVAHERSWQFTVRAN